MINPEIKAKNLRQGLIKNGKFLIAKIESQKQDPEDKKVLGVYFRYKDYINIKQNKKWFHSSLKDVWSSKFLGLNSDFLKLPLKNIKKLEFQNPSYSATFRFLGRMGDPRKYTKVFTVQVGGCNYDCIYCFVPEQ